MPITIAPFPPLSHIGPGLPIHLATDFLGPFPAGSEWQLDYHESPPGENVFLEEHWPDQVGGITIRTLTQPAPQTGPANFVPTAGAQVPVSAIFQEPGGRIVDQGTVTLPWDPQTGVGFQIPVVQQQGGGLTQPQAQQLDAVFQATAPAISLDALTLTDLTGGVPSGFVSAQLPNAIFGVIVRLTSIPPELATIGADSNYWLRTLAVVHIFRGSDLWVRAPIHTSNRIVPLPQEGLATSAAEDQLTAWLLQLSLQVTFAPGVLGEVFLMKYP